MARFVQPNDDELVNMDLVEYATIQEVTDGAEWVATMNSGRRYSLGKWRNREAARMEGRRIKQEMETRR